MAKVIRTTVDAEGNVGTDLSGFAGKECEAEEDRLCRGIARFGLLVQAESKARKIGIVNVVIGRANSATTGQQ